jgi:hypothetical protein
MGWEDPRNGRGLTFPGLGLFSVADIQQKCNSGVASMQRIELRNCFNSFGFGGQKLERLKISPIEIGDERHH